MELDSYLLRVGRSGDRISVVAKFSTPVHTGPGAHPVSCTTDTGSFPEVKHPGRGIDHPHPSRDEVKVRIELPSTSPLGLHGRSRANFTFLFLPLCIDSVCGLPSVHSPLQWPTLPPSGGLSERCFGRPCLGLIHKFTFCCSP